MFLPASRTQKFLLSILHAVVVTMVVWLLFAGAPPGTEHAATPLRRVLLCIAAFVYMVRTVAMLLVFLARSMSWGEAASVGVLIAVVQFTFAIVGGHRTAPVGMAEGVGAALYLAGSYLNSGSEWQRYRWKRDPQHSGHLYTGGLFRYAMHINYFGDVMLFTGWALMTGAPVLLIVPLLMAIGFVFFHIPALDKRLANHYGAAFTAYAARTKKLIPFVY